MAAYWEKVVAEDLQTGRGTVDVRMPAGGTQVGTKIYLGTFGLRWFVVTDYGAVGDGATDDTTAVQAAFTAAAVAGGTVYFPDGTYLLTSNIVVGSGVSHIVNILGPSWGTGGVVFSGSAVTKGFDMSGSGSAGTYQYAGTVSDLHIHGQNGALRGLNLYNLNHPRVVRVRLTSFAGCGVKFDYTLMGVFEHCLVSSCGSATEGSVEVDHSTTWLWLHSRISGGDTTVGGLLIDRTPDVTILGGAIESVGIPIKIASKTEGTTPVTGVTIDSIDLEAPGTHYLEFGYGWTGATFNGVKTVACRNVGGTVSGATDVRYAVKIKDTIDIHFDSCSFGLTGASQTAAFWLEGNTVLGLRTTAMRRSFSSSAPPWVMANGSQLSTASPFADWYQHEPRLINTPGNLTDTGSTPSIQINAQGGLYRYVTLTQSGATTISRFVFNGGANGAELYVKPLDANTTFEQATGSTQGMLKLLAGYNTAAVSGKVYHFVCDGTFWVEVGETPLQAKPIGSTTPVGTDADLNEKTLATFTIPANTLTATHTTGFTLDAFLAVVQNAGTVRVKINGVTIGTGPAALLVVNGGLTVHVSAQRASASSLAGLVSMLTASTSAGGVVAGTGFTATVDPTTTITITITGQNDASATADRIQFNRGFLVLHGAPDRAFA
jgi:hypothetical protein